MMSIVKEFVQKLYNSAKNVEAKEGFNALFILAQVALETGWLRYVSSDYRTGEYSYNLFNIKGKYNGESVRVPTTEYYAMSKEVVDAGFESVSEHINKREGRKVELISIGEYSGGRLKVRILDDFRKYPDYESSINDWIKLLKTKRYEPAYAVRGDLKQFAQKIYECGYATDPQYVSKILSVASNIKAHLPKEDEKPNVPVQEYLTYTVVPGDTLSGIAKRHGVPLSAIIELNQIQNPNLIYPGQTFKIKPLGYVVKEGESLTSIANALNISIERLVRANEIGGASLVAPGTVLRLPED
jgi:LysM repeat protein